MAMRSPMSLSSRGSRLCQRLSRTLPFRGIHVSAPSSSYVHFPRSLPCVDPHVLSLNSHTDGRIAPRALSCAHCILRHVPPQRSARTRRLQKCVCRVRGSPPRGREGGIPPAGALGLRAPASSSCVSSAPKKRQAVSNAGHVRDHHMQSAPLPKRAGRPRPFAV